MRRVHHQDAGNRIGAVTPACKGRAPCQGPAASEDWAAAALDALDVIRTITSNHCFAHSTALTQDDILAYALALMRLRECASAAGFERLTNACDALAVTVARLIEDRDCASREKCKTLTRFVVHAQAMIQMSIGGSSHHAMSAPARLVPANKASDEAGQDSFLQAPC